MRGAYDFDQNGRFDIRDYALDPRVNPQCPTGTSPFTRHEEGTTRGCVANGQHAYLNQVDVGGVETPYLSPEDLIAVFGHCRVTAGQLGACPAGGRFDNDGNGYPNDISGWNIQRNTNDPQTDDSAYSHAPGLISDLVGERQQRLRRGRRLSQVPGPADQAGRRGRGEKRPARARHRLRHRRRGERDQLGGRLLHVHELRP